MPSVANEVRRGIRVGVTLPTFVEDRSALDGARRAEDLGFDGVFVFDHIWPLGRPDRPALSAFPVLGAVAATTSRISLGPLVARVGLASEKVLLGQFASLARMAPGRLIAGLGTGDAKSAAEHAAYGIPLDPPEARRLALRRCALRLVGLGVPVWVGGGSAATSQLALDLGRGVALNIWGGQPAPLAALARRCEVTWAGPVDGGVPETAEWLLEIERAGATWAVCAWPRSLEKLADAVKVLRAGRARSAPDIGR